jgi:Zn-dependent peptidase ImmA (M78 family)
VEKLSEILTSQKAKFAKLAKSTGLNVSRLDELRNGARASLKEVRLIASSLKLGLDSLASAGSDETSASMMFRAAPVGGRPVNEQTRISLSRFVSDPISILANSSFRPTRWQSHFRSGLANSEFNASKFRELFCANDQFSPLTELPQIAQDKMGLLLLVINTNEVDGASGYLNHVPFAIVAARSFVPRMLFTLAHELGHLVLHHNPDQDGVIIDQTAEWGSISQSQSELEKEANEFASALLMPSHAVGVALKVVRETLKVSEPELGDLEINFISRLFGVSFGTSALRCEKLGLLPRGGAAALTAAVKDESSSPEVRAEHAKLPSRPDITFPAIPTALLQAAVSGVKQGDISVGRAASALRISIADIMNANVGGYA